MGTELGDLTSKQLWKYAVSINLNTVEISNVCFRISSSFFLSRDTYEDPEEIEGKQDKYI